MKKIKNKKIFIQSCCKYPRGGAVANYIENLSKAVKYAGYSTILVSALNTEYSILERIHFQCFDNIYIIGAEKGEEYIRKRKLGFVKERLEALRQENISSEDIVIVVGLRNEYMLKELFKYQDQIGFKVICSVFELFEREDFDTQEEYEQEIYIKEDVYLNATAILSISRYIDNLYNQKGMKTYRLPPLIDAKENYREQKNLDKYRFIIPTSKDSFSHIINAFVMLEKEKIQNIELHICNSDQETVRRYISDIDWDKIKDAVIVHKWLKYEDLVELYKEMHFLLIARKECQRTLANFPSKVPECMNLGIVPIVSDVGDYTKYFLEDGKDSIYIYGDSENEIIKSINKALSLSKEEYEKYSYNSRKCAETKFDYRSWTFKIKEMIENV